MVKARHSYVVFFFYFLLMSPFLYLSFCGLDNIWAARWDFIPLNIGMWSSWRNNFHNSKRWAGFFFSLPRNKEKYLTDSVVDSKRLSKRSYKSTLFSPFVNKTPFSMTFSCSFANADFRTQFSSVSLVQNPRKKSLRVLFAAWMCCVCLLEHLNIICW